MIALREIQMTRTFHLVLVLLLCSALVGVWPERYRLADRGCARPNGGGGAQCHGSGNEHRHQCGISGHNEF